MLVKKRTRMTAKQSRTAQRVLDSLERWEARFRGLTVERRRHRRVPYRTVVTIYVPDISGLPGVYSDAIDVWARNLSQSGLCFVHPTRLRSHDVVIALNPDSDRPMLFEAMIVRVREVYDGYWEHAVVFSARVDHPAAGPAQFGAVDREQPAGPSHWMPVGDEPEGLADGAFQSVRVDTRAASATCL